MKTGKIYRGCFLSVLLIYLCNLGLSSALASDTIILASIPYRQKAVLLTHLAPLVELLHRKLGREVEVVIADNYEDIGERLHHLVADLGILGPKSYVEAKEKFPEIQYLATNKNPDGFYYSMIIARKDAGINSLADLGKKSFAYTETGSTSGYLYPRQMLRNQGYDPDSMFATTYFLNKHDKVYAAVALKSVVGGAVSSSGMADAVEKFGPVFQALATSDPIPRNALVAGPRMSQGLVNQIREILRTAEDDPIFEHNTATMPIKGFLIKDDSFYDTVREHRENN
nr:phosphate/phosphite/phosphonate ABC transporter substrate-binding protein [uncultured Desulfobulbus sp.]